MADKKTYKTSKGVFEIPVEEQDAFIKDFPDAMEVQSFVMAKDTFDIPLSEVDEFVAAMPEAKPLKKKESTFVPFDNSLQNLPKDSSTASVGESPLASQEQPKPDLFKVLNDNPVVTNTALGSSTMSPVDDIVPLWNSKYPLLHSMDADDEELIKQRAEIGADIRIMKETPAGTISEFTQKYGVTPRDLGYQSNDINQDRQISKYDEELFKQKIQTKSRIDLEQNPEKYKGAFGSDITKDNYGLGFIKTVNTGLTAELLNAAASTGEFIGDMLGIEKKDGYIRQLEGNLRYVAEEQWPSMPNTFVGKTLDSGVYLTEMLTELALTPSIKIANASKLTKGVNTLSKLGFISKKGAVVVPKLVTQMAASNFVKAYASELDKEEEGTPMLSGLKEGAIGVGHAGILLGLGYASGSISKLFEKYGDKAALVMGAGVEGTGFAGYGAINSLVTNGEVDVNQIGADFVLGAGLHAFHYTGPQAELSKKIAERATQRYFSTTQETIDLSRQSTKTVQELRTEAIRLREEAMTLKDNNDKAINSMMADLSDGMADVKAVDQMVAKNPDVFIDSVKKDKTIDDKQKEIIISRIEDVVAEHKILNSQPDVKPKSKEDGKEVQAKETEVEKPTVESPVESEYKTGDSIPTEGKKGDLSKTETGYEIYEEIFGIGKDANQIRIDKAEDVPVAKERIDKLESDVDGLIQSRESADNTNSPYRVGDKTFNTKEEFIAGLIDMIKGKSVDAMFVMDDIKFAKDVSQKEVMDIVDQNALSGGSAKVDLELTSTSELMGIKDEVVPRVRKRIDKASELLNNQLKNDVADSKTTSRDAEISTISSEVGKDATQEKEASIEEINKDGVPEKTATQKIVDRVKARDEELKKGGKKGKWRSLSFLFFNQTEPFNIAAIKAGKDAKTDIGVTRGQQISSYLNLQAGSKGATKRDLGGVLPKIFGTWGETLSQGEQGLLSEIIDLKSTVATGESRVKSGKSPLLEESAPGDNVTYLDAKKALDDIAAQHPAYLELYGLKNYDYAKLESAANEYANFMKTKLGELYYNGIITEANYDQLLKDHEFYSPRVYLSHIEKLDNSGNLTGIKTLGEGSTGPKVVDIQTLLFDYTSRVNTLIAKAKTGRAMEELAKVNPENGLVKNAEYDSATYEHIEKQKSGETTEYRTPTYKETPKGFSKMDFIDTNGQERRLWVEENAYEFMEKQPVSDMALTALNWVSILSGNKAIKMAATGYNWEFSIKNLIADSIHVLHSTSTYSKIMPKATLQLASDINTIKNDVVTQTGWTADLIKRGGTMDMLSADGQIKFKKLGRYTKAKQVGDFINEAGSLPATWSELVTRTAIYYRWTNKFVDNYNKNTGIDLTEVIRTKKQAIADAKGITIDKLSIKDLVSIPEIKILDNIKDMAAAESRNYLDFEQGGYITKMGDKVIPYLNAGTQVTRGSLRAAGKDPVEWGVKMGQLTGLVAGVTLWNLGIGHKAAGIDEDKSKEMREFYLRDVPDKIKAKNFVVMTPFSYIDVQGNKRYLALKLPKDNGQELISGLAEDITTRAVTGVKTNLMDSRRFDELSSMASSFTGLTGRIPTFRAIEGYKSNYDAFFEKNIWTGKQQKIGGRGSLKDDLSQEFIPGVTPKRYEWMGKIPMLEEGHLSPMRSQYFAKQFFTESNLFATGIGKLLDGGVSLLDPELRTTVEKDIVEKFQKAPFLRRFLFSTYPMSASTKDYESAYAVEEQTNTNNYKKLLIKFDAAKTPEDKYKAEEEIYKWINDLPSVVEYNRLSRVFEKRLNMPEGGMAYYDLKFMKSIPRARTFFDIYISQPDQSVRDEMIRQLEDIGATDDVFWEEFDNLDRKNSENEVRTK